MAAETDKQWMRPVAKEGSSNVWKYFELELPDKKRVRCNKCPVKYFKYSGSTRMMWYHLEREHHISKSGTSRQSRSQIQSATTPRTEAPPTITLDNDDNGDETRSSSPVQADVGVERSATQTSHPPQMTQMSIAGSYARAKAKREPRDKMYARMASVDRFPFHTMAKSYDIQQRIAKEGHKPYLCPMSIARHLKYRSFLDCFRQEIF